MAYAMARDLANVRGAIIHSVFSRTEGSRRRFAKNFKATAFTTLEELLADEGVDIVYVNTFNNLHYPQVQQALNAGKHVVCEKPFTLNATQLTALVSLARSKNLFLMEAMWVRFLPAVAHLRKLLAEGILGEPVWMQASFHIDAVVDPADRLFDSGLGGGALLDLGIYPVSFSSMVFGLPREMMSSARIGATGVDTQFSAIFEYASGARAQVSAGFGGYFQDEIVIQGSKAQVRIPSGWRIDRFTVEIGKRAQLFKFPVKGRGYGYQAEEVHRCLNAGELESSVMPLDESLAIMGILDALRSQWRMTYPGEENQL
jgi:predicted dehydrogenase